LYKIERRNIMAIEIEKALEYYCEKCNKTMKGE
jgi:uncharacterized protein YuzE